MQTLVIQTHSNHISFIYDYQKSQFVHNVKNNQISYIGRYILLQAKVENPLTFEMGKLTSSSYLYSKPL